MKTGLFVVILIYLLQLSKESCDSDQYVEESRTGYCSSCNNCLGERSCTNNYCCGKPNLNSENPQCLSNTYNYKEEYGQSCTSDCECNGYRYCQSGRNNNGLYIGLAVVGSFIITAVSIMYSLHRRKQHQKNKKMQKKRQQIAQDVFKQDQQKLDLNQTQFNNSNQNNIQNNQQYDQNQMYYNNNNNFNFMQQQQGYNMPMQNQQNMMYNYQDPNNNFMMPHPLNPIETNQPQNNYQIQNQNQNQNAIL
ncbi:hypothetical protein PPERSA_07231 [Pseudocohnilembus persalinus]|uniref:Insulin-like growth factor binding protein, N-terminal n=1 Tax=Pseudocohnilembus persalinus TaxID=266149 RepID=A0A0V0QCW5_PSEPJ|nr:hypothetical protein PPERSA_07231 [Pseudocohnilembus persalinus]|eukprot:KRX00034.1 hypothetical protein PPERSA_07231 [Pseudocohnilembus persalinus]